MKNIVVVHGIGGIGKEQYFPHLKDTLEKLGVEVLMPSLGSYRDGITYNQWRDYFDKEIVKYINQDTIFVAQSIGTQFAVKYIVERGLNVGAYISCAGPYDVLKFRETAPERVVLFSPTSKLFKPTSSEFNAFKEKLFPKYSLFCNNDTFFEQINLENYAKAINATPILIKGKAHFEVPELTELEDLIKKIMEK